MSLFFPKGSLGSVPNVQDSHGGCGLLVEYGEEDAIGMLPFAVEQLTNLLAEECIFAGNGTAARHGAKRADGFDQALIPALRLLGGGVLREAEKGGVGFCFGHAG